ncbi:MAG: ATP-binding protein [Candidatus Sumerlaeota bacterium]|nr:ATP-binding protein [Candidatus Sumerlaeota bacterium]
MTLHPVESPSSGNPRLHADGEKRFCPGWCGAARKPCLYAILEHSTDAILIVDEQDVIRCWSRAAERLFGHRVEDILGKSVEILTPEHLRAAGEPEEIREALRRHGVLERHRTMRVAKDEQVAVVELSAATIADDDGTVVGALHVFRDLTEATEMERQIRQSQRLSTVAHLVTGLAHEIGTPLNVMSGRAELMMMDLPPNHPYRRELQVIIKETERIAELIRTLLSLARGGQRGGVRRCSLNGIVEEVLKIVGLQLKVANIEMEMRLARRLPLITVNRMQIVEVVLNLVVNAWHAMPEGGRIVFTTRTVERRDGPWVELSVADQGHGIAPEHFDKIFTPFFSTKAPGQGTGLGLPMALTIVQQHGGLIDFTSAPGKGATFTVTLPVERPKKALQGAAPWALEP